MRVQNKYHRGRKQRRGTVPESQKYSQLRSDTFHGGLQNMFSKDLLEINASFKFYTEHCSRTHDLGDSRVATIARNNHQLPSA